MPKADKRPDLSQWTFMKVDSDDMWLALWGPGQATRAMGSYWLRYEHDQPKHGFYHPMTDTWVKTAEEITGP